MLTDHQRAFISDSLNTEIFDDYGSWEVLNITYECSHHRHHIAEDRHVLEVLDDEGNPVPDGVEGNIIVSAYLEKAMPLVRYSIGDRGILNSEPCPCGRTFKTLKLTQGRTDYCIYLENGTKIYTSTLIWLPGIVDGVREIYIHQDKTRAVTVYYIPLDKEGADNEKIEKFILEYFIETTGISPQIKATDHIPRTKGGKARYVYSELSEDKGS
jgi:phenylacetate-CoA ligase